MKHKKTVLLINVVATALLVALSFTQPKTPRGKQPSPHETLNLPSTTMGGPSTSTSTPVLEDETSREEEATYRVVKVIDGDTIVLEGDINVRLLGMNAPEEGYPLYEESKERLSYLTLNKEVRLESDFQDEDRYHRLLRYVFVDDVFVNLQLVREGWAAVFMESGLKYESQFHSAEYHARLHGLGIWEKGVPYADYVYIVVFHYDAEGSDEENLNDEYVTLGNKGDVPVDMTGWTLMDEANHRFLFPPFLLDPGETVTIYTGSGKNTGSSLHWNSHDPIWNNRGDTLYLRDAAGKLVFSHEYG